MTGTSVQSGPPTGIIFDPASFGPVLVVEDDDGNAFVIRTILELLGLTHHRVSSGEAALEAVRTTCFSVILLDIVLQGIGGLETARAIRERERQEKRKPSYMIAVTCKFSDEFPHEEIQAFLHKPVTMEKLVNALNCVSQCTAADAA